MKRLFVPTVLFCLAAVSLLQASRAQSTAAAPAVLRVICLPARPLALTVGVEQGLFAKYGVEVQAQIAANSEELRSALAGGTVELAHAAVDNAVALVEKARVDVTVVMGGEGSTNELIAQPSIHSVRDLRGQTVIVDAPTTAYALQLKKILLLGGLEVERDYQIKQVGGTPLRLAAMREHRDYAASILGPPASLIAKHGGFISLGSTQQFIGPYQGVGAFVRRQWAQENRELLSRYVAAFIEAQRWILDPAHKAEVIALLEKESKLSGALANETYNAWIVAPGGLETDAKINLEGFTNVLRLRAEIEHTWSGETPGPEKYYDSSYYDAALSKLSPTK
jgi:ABC-type nitrate/sulfonate/bicarbonate transport system substrate-binding protein